MIRLKFFVATMVAAMGIVFGAGQAWAKICWSNHVKLFYDNLHVEAEYADSYHTSGQPWKGMSTSHDDDDLDILIKCGRKGSKDTADWFKSKLDYERGAISKSTEDALPSELNFTALTWLHINSDKYLVQFAQGHSPATSRNNWWLGGEGCIGNHHRKNLQTRDGKYTFTIHDSVSEFRVSANSIHPKWMQMYIDDSVKLSDIAMPGTHDTGTYALHDLAIDHFSVCQDYSILSQLNFGVRVLDIRLGLEHGHLNIYHGGLKADLSFDTVLRQAFEFLDKNPDEAVVMVVKHEHGDGVADAFAEALTKRDSDHSRYWLKDSMPTMGEARGKIVFVNRNGNIGDKGINVSWKDNTTFKSNGKVDFHIQDYYNEDFGGKIKHFEELMKDQISDPDSYWYFNYVSISMQNGNLSPRSNAEHMNPLINDMLAPYAKAGADKVNEVVVLDFAGRYSSSSIISRLIENNQHHSGDSLSIAGAETPEISFTSQRKKDDQGQVLDKFSFEFKVDITDKSIDPTTLITQASDLSLACGDYVIDGGDGLLGNAREAKWVHDTGDSERTKGKVKMYPHVNDEVVVKWSSEAIKVKIQGTFTSEEGGVNIVNLSEHGVNTPAEGGCDFKLRLGPYAWAGTLHFTGKSGDGDWEVESTSASPLQ